MRRKFDQIDVDQSGKLDRDEMVKMAELLRIQNFEVADMDLAAEGQIAFEDFQAWCREVVWWGNKKGAYLYPNRSVEKQLAGHF